MLPQQALLKGKLLRVKRIHQSPAHPFPLNVHQVPMLQLDPGPVTKSIRAKKMNMHIPGQPVIVVFEMVVFQVFKAMGDVVFAGMDGFFPKDLSFPANGYGSGE